MPEPPQCRSVSWLLKPAYINRYYNGLKFLTFPYNQLLSDSSPEVNAIAFFPGAGVGCMKSKSNVYFFLRILALFSH